jgi:hypothetical protein
LVESELSATDKKWNAEKRGRVKENKEGESEEGATEQ